MAIASVALHGCGRHGFEPGSALDAATPDAPPCLVATLPCRVLDTFDRPDGPLTSPWYGAALTSFAIANNELVFEGDETAAVLHDTIDHSADQYAFVTLAEDMPYFHLALRSNDAGTSFLYANIHGGPGAHVHIGFYDGGHNDLTGTSVSFVTGDEIMFATVANVGTIYINGTAVDTASVASTPRAATGGRIGLLWLGGLGPTRLDDFGGGGLN